MLILMSGFSSENIGCEVLSIVSGAPCRPHRRSLCQGVPPHWQWHHQVATPTYRLVYDEGEYAFGPAFLPHSWLESTQDPESDNVVVYSYRNELLHNKVEVKRNYSIFITHVAIYNCTIFSLRWMQQKWRSKPRSTASPTSSTMPPATPNIMYANTGRLRTDPGSDSGSGSG